MNILWFSETHMFEVAKGDKLDDVPEDGFSFGRPQDPVIPIQHLHVTEVSVPYPDDNDGHRKMGGLDDGFPGVGHVGDDAVSQDQQNEVLLEQEVQVSLDRRELKVPEGSVSPWPLWCGPPARRTWQPSG